MSTSVGMMLVVLLLALVSVMLQKSSPSFALILSVAAACFLLWKAGQAIQTVFRGIALLGRQSDGQAFSCLLRCTGILLLTDYVRTVCEEAGAGSLGWCTGFAGRFLMLSAMWPLVETILQTIWGLAG